MWLRSFFSHHHHIRIKHARNGHQTHWNTCVRWKRDETMMHMRSERLAIKNAYGSRGYHTKISSEFTAKTMEILSLSTRFFFVRASFFHITRFHFVHPSLFRSLSLFRSISYSLNFSLSVSCSSSHSINSRPPSN